MKKEREWMKKVNGRPSVRAIQYPLLTGLRCTCAAKLILLRRTKRTNRWWKSWTKDARIPLQTRNTQKKNGISLDIWPAGLRFFHFHFSLLHQRSIVKALFCLHYYYYTFLGPLLLARLFKRNTELRSVSKEEEENYFDREKSPRMV